LRWGFWSVRFLLVFVFCSLGSLAALSLFLFPYPREVLAIFAGAALTIWLTLAFQAFKRRERLAGKVLFGLAMIWSGVLSIPLILLFDWEPVEAVLTVLGISACALLLCGVSLKLVNDAKARKEARYRRVIGEVDSAESLPWEQ